MKLKFTIGSYFFRTDYTDYVEKVSIQQHADSLIQADMPNCSMTIYLSTVLPETVKVGDEIFWGVGAAPDVSATDGRWVMGKETRMIIKKIDRAKHKTTLWASQAVTQGELMKGLVTPTNYWRVIFDGDLTVDESLLNLFSQYYVQDTQQLLLGFANSASQKTVVEHSFPRPWSKDSVGSKPTLRQVQTASEFQLQPKDNVAQYKILYQDVVEEDEYSSQVTPNSVLTSRLNQQRSGKQFNYKYTSSWEAAMQQIRLHECPQSGTYGVTITTGSDTSQASELHLSDGTVFNVQGIVIGVASELIYVYQPSSSTQGVVKAVKLDGTVVQQVSVDNFATPATHNVFQDFNTRDVVCQLRQTTEDATKPSDLIFLGRPVAQGTNMCIGFARYKANGTTTMSMITPYKSYTSFDMGGCWLIGAYPQADHVLVTYAKQGGIVQFKVQYDGTIKDGPYTHDYEFYSSDSSIYPISAARDNSLYNICEVTGYTISSPRFRYGSSNSSYQISWTSISGDTAYMGWYAGTHHSIVTRSISGINGAQRNGHAWRPYKYSTEYSFAPLEGYNNAGWYSIIGQSVSVVVLNDVPYASLRTVSMEPSPLPRNTYDLYPVKTKVHEKGENGEVSMPYLLQGGRQSWELVPVDKTRIKVRTSALECSAYRTESVVMQPTSSSSYARQYLYAGGANYYVKPGHTYYMSVEILAPNGIQATQANFAYPWADRLLLIDLSDTPASQSWVKKSVLVQVSPTFVDEQRSYVSGARSIGAQHPWMFRKPILVDLTQTYGAGNEPGQEWCDANITQFDDNIFDPAAPESRWYKSGAVLNTTICPNRHKVDNDNLIIPQVGCPVLYQRNENQGVVDNHVVVDCIDGWENLYIPFHVAQGLTYTVRFDWKVNSTYQPLNQEFPGVMFQVLNAPPAGDGNVSMEVARINLPTQEGLTSQELTFTAPDTGTYYFDFNFGGAADGQVVDVDVQNIQVTSYGDAVLDDAFKSLINWEQSIPQFTITSTGGLEEGVILGFDYEFGGATSLWVDILLLGQPKPWSNSYLNN